MDGEVYLNQIAIAKQNNSSDSFLSSKLFKIIIAAVISLILILIFGSLLAPSDNVKSKLSALKLHVNNLSDLVTEYQPYIKSSSLRSNAASLNSVLINTSKTCGDYLAEKYQIQDDKGIEAKVTQKETDLKEKLSDDLFNARINGLIDRTFASKMAYEITIITTREKEIYKLTKKEDLKNILETSFNSLDNLYNSFNNYSETR